MIGHILKHRLYKRVISIHELNAINKTVVDKAMVFIIR